MSKNVRKRREKLWNEKDGKCFYCGVKTILPVRGVNTRHPPDNLATLDHLRTRLHIEYDEYGEPVVGCRHEPNTTNEERTCLACLKCNNIRGILDQKSTQDMTIIYAKPIDER